MPRGNFRKYLRKNGGDITEDGDELNSAFCQTKSSNILPSLIIVPNNAFKQSTIQTDVTQILLFSLYSILGFHGYYLFSGIIQWVVFHVVFYFTLAGLINFFVHLY